MASADELTIKMVNVLLKDMNIDGKKQEEVALMINGFGATPLQELYLLNNSVSRELNKRNVKIYRTFVGNYMTSIDMAGASVSIMKVDEQLKDLLSEVSEVPSFKVSGPVDTVEYVDIDECDKNSKEVSFEVETNESFSKIEDNKLTLQNMMYIVDKMSEVIIKNEVPFCELDSHAGDGDFGMSAAKGFKQLKREWKNIISNKNLNKYSRIFKSMFYGNHGTMWWSIKSNMGIYI